MVAWAVFYIFLRNPNGNRYVLYLYLNGREWNWNYNWLDNHWNADNPSASLATLFISLSFFERVLFNKLSRPSAKIFSNFVQF